ncbi:MAG: hypothetical protein JNJ54_12965 [Myxococcaceae bacterium]|nr:hypothetical protein [Myxococcaceae bacterium]
MPDDKSLGKRLLGLFVESVPDAGDPSAQVSGDGTPTAADEIAALARQSEPGAAPGPAVAPVAAAQRPAPPPGPARVSPAAGTVEPARIDFDAVFKNAGIDPHALDRVRKAEELLKTLPDSASDEVKRQIVEASLKAFGFEVAKIVEAVETQTKALDTYVRVNEQQTAKSITDAQAQIAKLEDQVITLKAEIDKRTTSLASLAAAADVRRRQVARVRDFFQTPPTGPAGAPPASKSDD